MKKNDVWKWWALGILLALNLIAALMACYLTVRETAAVKESGQLMKAQLCSGCMAVPVSLLRDDPVCANRLLEALNVQGVQIVPEAWLESRLTEAEMKALGRQE